MLHLIGLRNLIRLEYKLTIASVCCLDIITTFRSLHDLVTLTYNILPYVNDNFCHSSFCTYSTVCSLQLTSFS